MKQCLPVLFLLAACNQQPAATPAATEAVSSVSAQGFTLVSVSQDLPIDSASFPPGPGADAMNANCAACHSTSMILTQPILGKEAWMAIITKMRDVHDAPIADADVPVILDYLLAMQAKRPQ